MDGHGSTRGCEHDRRADESVDAAVDGVGEWPGIHAGIPGVFGECGAVEDAVGNDLRLAGPHAGRFLLFTPRGPHAGRLNEAIAHAALFRDSPLESRVMSSGD